MKNRFLLCVLLFPALAFAQFPAPQNFQISINYILLGESGWCNNQLIQGPTYCYLFEWQAPDTASTPATLVGYRIYRDNLPFFQTNQTLVETSGTWFGSFYVAAIYENPAGESDSSNVVSVFTLPISTNEISGESEFGIAYLPVNQQLVIHGTETPCDVSVFDLRGTPVLRLSGTNLVQLPAGLPAGAYCARARCGLEQRVRMFVKQ